MQKWKCHKVVEAFKIAEVRAAAGTPDIFLLYEEGNRTSVAVKREYMVRNHRPVGGYFVKYRDGYESWSPASEFEAGYTKLDERPSSWWRRMLDAVS